MNLIRKSILDLPNEILNTIFSFIYDTDTYKNARLVCIPFRNILKDVKVFENNKIKLIYLFDKENNKISILNENYDEVGFIKTTYPCMIESYLKLNDTKFEKKVSRNEITTIKTREKNRLLFVNIDSYNIDNKTHKFKTLTKYLHNQDQNGNNGAQGHFIHPHQLPFMANPNGCTIC